MLPALFSLYLKMLVLYSPFFVLSCFISMTRGYTVKERRFLAWKVALGSMIASALLYLFGNNIFTVFGVTIDAFRIGAGSVLFISALAMAQTAVAATSSARAEGCCLRKFIVSSPQDRLCEQGGEQLLATP